MKGKALRKLLSLALSTVFVGSMTITAVPVVFARDCMDEGEESTYFRNHTIGIVGAMTDWGETPDVPLEDIGNNRVYVGAINGLEKGDYEFKIRADSSWDDSWGEYEPDYDRTFNSQTSFSTSPDVDSDLVVVFDTNGSDGNLWPAVHFTMPNGGGDKSISFNSLGVIGGFTKWCSDVEMTEISDGIYAASIGDLSEGTEFKVRADENWDYSWGVYEEDYERTLNSQTNFKITENAKNVTVFIDTNGTDAELWPVVYTYTNSDGELILCSGNTPAPYEDPKPKPNSAYGIIGNMTGWGETPDVSLEDIGNGIYEGNFTVDAGEYEFKVRQDQSWDYSWSVYEEDYERTLNSQTNVSFSVDNASTITVRFDTTGDIDYWPVSYSVNGGDFIFTGKQNLPLENTSKFYSDYYTYRVGESSELEFNYSCSGGESPVEYAVYIYNKTKGWKQLEDYTDDYGWHYVNFTPEVEGENTVRVKAKDANGDISNKDFTINVKPDFENTSYISNTIVQKGNYVDIYCQAYSSEEVQYAVYVQESGSTKWTQIQGYSTEEYPSWRADKVGQYKIRIKAKNESGKISNKDINVMSAVCGDAEEYSTTLYDYIYFDNSKTKWDNVYAYWWNDYSDNIYDITKTDYNAEYPGVKMTKTGSTDIWQIRIPFNASHIMFTNGVTDEQLRNGADCRVTNDLEFNSFNNAGQIYTINTSTEPKTGKGIEKTKHTYTAGKWSAYTGTFKSENITPPLVNNSWASDYVDLGESVGIDCYASGGKGNKQFAVYYKKSDAKSWTKLSDYKTDSSYYFTPSEAGNYVVRVKAKDEAGTVVNKDIDVEVVKRELVNRSYLDIYMDEEWNGDKQDYLYTVDLGAGTEVYCTSYGGVGTKTYSVFYKKSDKTSWTKVSDYNEDRYIRFTFPEEGEYTVRVKAKDAEGKIENKDIAVQVVKSPLKINNVYHSESYSYGREISIDDIYYEGGAGDVTTTVYYKQTKQTKWTKASGKSFTPKALTTYDVKVELKDKTGDTADFTFTISITAPSIDLYTYFNNVSDGEMDLGESAQISYDVEGGYGALKASFSYKLESETTWTELVSTSDSYYTYFTPDSVGSYVVRVKVKDELGTETYKDLKLKVVEPVFKNLSDAENANLGNPVSVYLYSKNGTGTVRYAVYYKPKDQTKWTKASDYTSKDYVEFTPKKEGVYDVRIKAKDSTEKIVNADMTVTVTRVPLENESYVSYSGKWDGKDASLYDDCYVYSESYGGVGKKLYSIYYKKSGAKSWTMISDYSDIYRTKVTFPEEGSYIVRVKAKDEEGTVVNEDITVKVSVVPLEVYYNQTFINYNETPKFTVTAETYGGIGEKKYALYYKQSSQTNWTKAADYSYNNEMSFNPKAATTYNVKVMAKDEKDSVAETVFDTEIKMPELQNSAYISESEIDLGDTTEITADAYGGWGKKQAAVYYKLESSSKWTKLKDYSDEYYVEFKPEAVGTYDVRVKVKDSKNKVVDCDLKLNVLTPVFKNLSKTSYECIELGKYESIDCMSKNGKGNVEYAVYYKLKDSAKWTLLCDYSYNTSVRFTPDAVGVYNIRVKAKDEAGKIVNSDHSLVVEKNTLENMSYVDCDRERLSLADGCRVCFESKGGEGEKLYAVSYQKDGQTDWTTVIDYEDRYSVPVVFAEEGKYTVRISVKDSAGTVADIDEVVYVSKTPLEFSYVDYNREGYLGSTVYINLRANGGAGDTQYALYYKQSKQTKWTKASDYSASSDLTFTPKAATTYDCKVMAKDKDGTVIERLFTIEVTIEEFKFEEIGEERVYYLGDSVYVSENAFGGVGEKQYAVYYKQESQTSWTKAYDFTDERKAFTPKAATTYDIKVQAKDEKGTVIEDLRKVKINKTEFINNSYISNYDDDDSSLYYTVYVRNCSKYGTGLVTYAVYYKLHDASKWTQICNYTTLSSVGFTPKTEGIYDVRVKAKDEAGKIVNKDLSVNVKKLPLEISSYIYSDHNVYNSTFYNNTIPQNTNCSASISACNGAQGYTYSVSYKKFGQTKWTTVSDFSENRNVDLPFKETGVYIVRTAVKDSEGATAVKDLSVEIINMPLTIQYTNYDISYSENCVVNTYMSTIGGTGKVQYAAYYKQNSQKNWTKISDYSDENSFIFNPKAITTYNVKLLAKDEAGTIAEKVFNIEVKLPELENYSYLPFNAIDLGDKVTVYARSYGGWGAKQYAVYYKQESQSSWTKISDYTDKTEFSFTPKAIAKYDVRVKVKDSKGTVVNSDMKFMAIKPVFRNNSYVGNSYPYLGQSVNVYCRSKNGAGTVQYAVFYKKHIQSGWTKLSDYSTNEIVKFNPTEIGQYDLRIKAKDSNGTILNSDFFVEVTIGPLSNSSTLKTDLIRLTDIAVVNCDSMYGHGNIQYAVFYKQTTQKNWTKISDYSSDTTFKFIPKAAKDYVVLVKAKDEDGTISESQLDLSVKDVPFLNTSTASYTDENGIKWRNGYFRDNFTVNYSSSGGKAPVQYAVYYRKSGTTTWTKVVDYTKVSSSLITPKIDNKNEFVKFDVRVKAKSADGTVSNRDFTMYHIVGKGQK